MPTYNFRNKETDEEFEIQMSIAELDKYKEDNPHLEQFLTRAPAISGGIVGIGRMKNDDGWREMQSRIAEAHPQSEFASQFGKRSIKEVKTQQVLEKHRKRQAQQKKGK